MYLYLRFVEEKSTVKSCASIQIALHSAFRDIKTHEATPHGILDLDLKVLYNKKEILKAYAEYRGKHGK